jgi:hypothetical protein
MISVSTRAGWEIVTLRSGLAEVDILPGKGGDILSVRRRADTLEFLWVSPWGLRPRGALSAAGDSEGRLMEAYPGGWQTVFPNGGDPAATQRTTWGMHGEAWLAPFRWEQARPDRIRMHAELVHSPFRIEKTITLDGPRVAVSETITSRGGHPLDVMWSHHPAFGPPFLCGGCRVEAAAAGVAADEMEGAEHTDLRPGHAGRWPYLPGREAGQVDLRLVPPPEAGTSRLAYLTGFTQGLVTIRNEQLDAGVRLEWDPALMPHAWYWLEARGTAGFPWYQAAYVLGIEPATSLPGHGITQARAAGTAVTFAPGESKTAQITLTITDGSGAVLRRSSPG